MRRDQQADHRTVAALCRANPGTWQPVGEYGNSESAESAVRMIRGALRRSSGESPYAPARTFEARRTLTDNGAWVEARYIGQLVDRVSPLALTAKQVIENAWLHGPSYDLATQAAEALESARLLQSPETIADLEAAGMYAAADLVDEAFHGEPFLNYPPDFAALIRQKAQEKSSREADATPAEFFRPGRVYIRDLPFRAPEDTPSFECVGIGAHPSKDGALLAFGFERPGAGQPWVSASQRMEEWSEGWVDLGPAVPDRLTQTFAPTQTLREGDDA